MFCLLFRWGILHRVLLVVGWCQVLYSSGFLYVQFSSVAQLYMTATPWNAAHQASLSITSSQSLLTLMSLSQWCHPTISSSVVSFSSCSQSFPASESFQRSQLFASRLPEEISITSDMRSSLCNSPKHPVSCIKHRLAICFLHDSIHVSVSFSQIIPSSSESKSPFYTSVSLLLSCIKGNH